MIRLKSKEVENNDNTYILTDLVSHKYIGKWILNKNELNKLVVRGKFNDKNFNISATLTNSRPHPLLKEKFKLIQEHALIR